jgi:hypothetical protein
MIRVCKSCGKEFQSFSEGEIYSIQAQSWAFYTFAQMNAARIKSIQHLENKYPQKIDRTPSII